MPETLTQNQTAALYIQATLSNLFTRRSMHQKDKKHRLGPLRKILAIARLKSHASKNTISATGSSMLVTPNQAFIKPTRSAGEFIPDDASPQLSPIAKLPVEILERIVHFVSTTTTLRNLALCCRRFHQLTEPRLFRSICIPFDCNGVGHADNIKCGVRDFCLHLLTHPGNFAHLVKHVRLRGPASEPYDPRTGRSPLFNRSEKVDLEFKLAAESYVETPTNASTKLVQTGIDWLKFTLGDPVTRFVLLLALLPQTETFHVQMPGERVLADKVLSLDILSELQEVTLEWTPRYRANLLACLHGAYLQDLLPLASLRKVCLIRYASHPWGPSVHRTSLAPQSLLKCLELRKSGMADNDFIFGQLVPTLNKFIYEHDHQYSWVPILTGQLISPSTMIKALSMRDNLVALQPFHNKSLESIWLDFTRDPRHKQSESSMHCFDRRTLQTLPRLEVLRHLCFPLEFMLKIDSAGMCEASFRHLPLTLETLVLINHLDDWKSPVSAFLKEFLQLLLELRTGSHTNLDSSLQAVPRLRKVVVIANVEQFLHCSPATLACLGRVPNLDVTLGQVVDDENDVLLEDRECTEKIKDIEDIMGLTRLGPPRGIGVDIAALKQRCRHYETLKDMFGAVDESGLTRRPRDLDELTNSMRFCE